jgi:DNA adenine methylase
MPPHQHYLEPYFGGGSVLLRKDFENTSEVICDRNGDLTNFWMTLQNPPLFEAMKRILEATPFSEVEYETAFKILKSGPGDYYLATGLADKGQQNMVVRAYAYFVVARQSMAGRNDCFTPVTKTRLRRRMSNEVSAWLTSIECLPAVHRRLQRVLILKPQKAQKLIPQYDKPGWLQYLDPPYHPETRESNEVYDFEMTAEEHDELLDIVNQIQHAWIMLSGYRHPSYDTVLRDWNRHEMVIDNKASKKATKDAKIECLWTNW